MTQTTKESVADERAKPASAQSFPWERQPDESAQAFQRFCLYRSTSPSDRSYRKLGVSYQLIARWARKHSWMRRTSAYDAWLTELHDSLSNHAILYHRSRVAALGRASVRKVASAIDKLNESKLSADEIVMLGKFGVETERQALGLTNEARPAAPSVVVQTGVSLGSAQGPNWLTKTSIDANQTEANETKPVLPSGEKVLGEMAATPPRARLLERVVNCPKVNRE